MSVEGSPDSEGVQRKSAVTEAVRAAAEANQLICLGASDLDLAPDFKRFQEWLDGGMAAGMGFMARHRELRSDPRSLLPSARSAVVVGCQYSAPALGPASSEAGLPRAAKYSRFKDYHRLMRKRLEALAGMLPSILGVDKLEYRVCVDSAPLLERALARKTGAGFIGKNSCFISWEHGSFLLLGVMLCSLPVSAFTQPLPVITPDRECGTCRRCEVHCPTGAIISERRVDARRCLAYWSIEHRGAVPREFWPFFKDYYFGCDLCQDVCPWNRRARPAGFAGLGEAVQRRSLAEIAAMTRSEYEAWFGGTPLTRAKREGLQRNALLALWAMGAYQELSGILDGLASRDDTDAVLWETLNLLRTADKSP